MLAHVKHGHFILVNDEGDCSLLTRTFHPVGVFADYGLADQAAKKRNLMSEAEKIAEQIGEMEEREAEEAALRENNGE